MQGVAKALPKPEQEMGPALPSQLCEKQRKGQSCTLSPALRGDTNTLSKNFSNSSRGEGKPKDNSLSRVLFLCKGPNPPHPTGEEEEMWDGGAALARSAETSTTGRALLTTGWGSSGCPGSHSHQNPPESTRIQLLWKGSESPQLPLRAIPTSSIQRGI